MRMYPMLGLTVSFAADTTTEINLLIPGGGIGSSQGNRESEGFSNTRFHNSPPEIATWLNSIGITGIVLKYRVPGNLDGAFQDIQRAIRIVRHNAAEWNISPMHIGVMGFSAGGHLSARLSTNFSQATYPRLDVVDDKNLRPDFAILVYPAYLSK